MGKFKWFLIFTLIAIIALISYDAYGAWFDDGLRFRRDINISEGLSYQFNNTPFLLNFSQINEDFYGELQLVQDDSFRLPTEVVSGSEIWFNATLIPNGGANIRLYYNKTGNNGSYLPLQVWNNYTTVFHFETATGVSTVNNSANVTTNGSVRNNNVWSANGLFGRAWDGGLGPSNNDFVNFDSVLNVINDANVTIGIWFNATENDQSSNNFIWQLREVGVGEISLTMFADGIRLIMEAGSTAFYHNASIAANTSWHQAIVVLNTDGGAIYFDGELVNNTVAERPIGKTQASLGTDARTGSFFLGKLDEFFIYSGVLSNESINASYQLGIQNYAPLGSEVQGPGNIIVLLENPTDNAFNNSASINFTCSAEDIASSNLANVTFNLYDSGGTLDATTIRVLATPALTANESFLETSIADDVYTWNCIFRDFALNNGTASNNTLTVDTTAPIIIIDQPTGLFNSTAGIPINYSEIETNSGAINYTVDGGQNNISLSGNTTFTANNSGDFNLTITAVDQAGNQFQNSSEFFVNLVKHATYDGAVIEQSREGYALLLSRAQSASASVRFYFNNTVHTVDSISSLGNNNYSYNFNITTDFLGTVENTTITPIFEITHTQGTNTFLHNFSFTQTLYQFLLDDCRSDFTNITRAINFTLRNESSILEEVNIESVDMNFDYKAGVGSTTKNFAISIGTMSTGNFSACIYPHFVNLTSDYQINYEGVGYSARDYFIHGGAINNDTQVIDLFLLNEDIITSVTIALADVNGDAIPGYIIEAQRKNVGNNTFNIVSTKISDASGKALFTLETTGVIYKFTVKDGDGDQVFESSEFEITQSTYTFNIIDIGIDILRIQRAIQSITHNLSFQEINAYNFSFFYSDNQNVTNRICFSVVKQRTFNQTFLSVQCSTADQNIFSFVLPDEFGNTFPNNVSAITGIFIASTNGTAVEDGNSYIIEVLSIDLRGYVELFGNLGLFIFFLGTIFFIGMGAVTRNVYVISMLPFFWIVYFSIMGIIPAQWGILAGIFGVLIVVLWRVKS